MKNPGGKFGIIRLMTLAIALSLALACGGTAAPTTAPPTNTAAPTATRPAATAAPTQAPRQTTAAPTQAMPQPTATRPAAAPTATPVPTQAPTQPAVSAKSKAILVIGSEPEKLFWPQTSDAHTTQVTEQMTYYTGHLDKDTLQVSPTSMVMSWEQTAPDEWIYHLRPGVTYQDGEKWNAEAWKTMASFTGVPEFSVGAYAHTGPYSVEPVDELTAKIKCGEACPVFNRGLGITQTVSPKPLKEEDFRNITYAPGAGPFKLDDWQRGSKILMSKFENFVPAPESPEYAAPKLDALEFQWRGETTVRAAMIETGEADWAFLITLEDAARLGPDRFVTGGTSEINQMRVDTIWHPWLSQLKMRQAIVHSINCEAIVESLYQGATTCRGNSGAPGVLGITEENIKPYEYDSELSKRLLAEIGYTCGLSNSAPNCGMEILIQSRADRLVRNTELVEAIVGYMREVGINAKAQFVDVGIRTAMSLCGVGTSGSGATVVGWKGATQNNPPTCTGGVTQGDILDGFGFGYETLDYAKFMSRHLMCESGRSAVCVPEKEEEFVSARSLAGAERKAALEAAADWAREYVAIIPLFDEFAVYGVNPKLRGFEEPRFDKHTFSGLWSFAP